MIVCGEWVKQAARRPSEAPTARERTAEEEYDAALDAEVEWHL